jgi:large subunit ribosomal protein L24
VIGGAGVNKVHVKKGDHVIILKGKDRGKKGKVIEVSPKEDKVIVEGANTVTKHVKPRKVGQQGGIVKAEAPLYACKVMLICTKCNKPTRSSYVINEDGTKDRVCKHCGEAI